MSRELLTTCSECGAQIVFGENEEIVTCEYCYTKNARPKSSGDELAALKRGNELRANCEFEEALKCYEYVLRKYPDEHEALWGKLLCKYGVETVEEERYGKTTHYHLCHRVRKTALRNEGDFRRVLGLAPSEIRAQYEETAGYVDNVQAKVREKVAGKEGYEVFICYKETAPGTETSTPDSRIARELCLRYQKAGYKVFFAPYTLAGKAGEDYEAEIYLAVTTANVMIVIGTKPEYMNATWPKSEWSRYLDVIGERDGLLIPLYRDMTARQLPEEFRNLNMHGISMDANPNYAQDLEMILERRLRPGQDNRRDSQPSPQPGSSPAKKGILKILSVIFVIAIAAGGFWLGSSSGKQTPPRGTADQTPTETQPSAAETPIPTEKPVSTATPTPEPSATPDPLLIDEGSPKESVRKLQQMLIDAGFLPEGSADGIFGRNTESAVTSFQQWINEQNGAGTVSVTGAADSVTQEYLESAANQAMTVSAQTPEVLPETRRIVVGPHHVVGLKSDGTVVAVGDNDHGQCDTKDWRDITAVDTGYFYTVGLKSDGTVAAIGDNKYGQCNTQDWRDIVAIASGGVYTVGLKSDGSVVAVGKNEDGQCNTQNWRDIVAIAASDSTTVGLKSDGTVVAVGWNAYGQCDTEGWHDIVAIAADGRYTVGLKSDGTVVAVGYNDYGACDTQGWRDIVAIAAGGNVAGLKADGTVVTTGYTQFDTENWRDIAAVAVDSYNLFGLKADGTVIAAGLNNDGQCDTGKWRDIVEIDSNNGCTVGVRSDGSVVAVGSNYKGKLKASGWDLF